VGFLHPTPTTAIIINNSIQKQVDMTPLASSSRLLCLPTELRFGIYDHLCVTEPKSYPFRHSPVSSIDRTPPPTALLLSCRFLHDEVERYFYRRATLRFIAHPWRAWYEKHNLSSLKAIRLAKRAEILLTWNAKALRGRCKKEVYWSYIEQESLASTVELLRDEGTNLEVLILTVQDCSNKRVEWSVKQFSLRPLENVPPQVNIVVGKATFSRDSEDEELKENLRDHLERLVREQQT
jgi:hypothetical protein